MGSLRHVHHIDTGYYNYCSIMYANKYMYLIVVHTTLHNYFFQELSLEIFFENGSNQIFRFSIL